MNGFKATIVAIFVGSCLLRPVQAAQEEEATQKLAESPSFDQLAAKCAPSVHIATLQALARTESRFNPYAIGVVDGTVTQPKTLDDAIATAKALHKAGKNFSMGLAQINKYNLPRFGLSYETVFDPCQNLQAGAQILGDCFDRAGSADSQIALQKALSCYYSGNFKTGFTQDFKGQPSYVKRIQLAAAQNADSQKLKIPAINPNAPLSEPAKATVKSSSAKKVKRRGGSDKAVATEGNEKRGTASWDAFADW